MVAKAATSVELSFTLDMTFCTKSHKFKANTRSIASVGKGLSDLAVTAVYLNDWECMGIPEGEDKSLLLEFFGL